MENQEKKKNKSKEILSEFIFKNNNFFSLSPLQNEGELRTMTVKNKINENNYEGIVELIKNNECIKKSRIIKFIEKSEIEKNAIEKLLKVFEKKKSNLKSRFVEIKEFNLEKSTFYILSMKKPNYNIKEYFNLGLNNLTNEQIIDFFLQMISCFKNLQNESENFSFYLNPENIKVFREKSNLRYKTCIIEEILEGNKNETLSFSSLFFSPEIHKNYSKQILNENITYSALKDSSILIRKFKGKIFSLGIIILWLTGIEIGGINQDEEILKERIKEFKKKFLVYNENFDFFIKIIERILEWEEEKRIEFNDLLEMIYSENNIHWKKFLSLNVDLCKNSEECKTEILKNKNSLNNLKFIKTCSIKNHYLEMFINSGKYKRINKLIKEIENHFLNNRLNLIEKNQIFDIIKNKKNVKIKDLIEIYKNNTQFCTILNSSLLSEVNIGFIKCYLQIFLSKLTTFNSKNKIIPEIVYSVHTNEKNISIDLENQFLIGKEYYLPNFIITSTSENIAKEQFVNNSTILGNELVLLKMKLNKSNKRNKVVIERKIKDETDYKNENEILILPYFHYKVVNIYSEKNSSCGKIYLVIEIDEVEENNCINIEVVWFDPNINNKENFFYQNLIKEIYKNFSCFDSEEECIKHLIKKKKDNWKIIFITSKNFTNKLQNIIIKENETFLRIICFTYSVKNASYLKKIKPNIRICNDIMKILLQIPNQKSIY